VPLFPPGVRRALRLPSSAERLARDLDEEVAFHLEARVADLVARGMSEDAARAEAQRRFGDTDDLRDYCHSIEVPHMRRVRIREWWEGWLQDLRFGTRQFARSPGFFLIAVLTLALGIGASTAIFSVVRGVVLRPLPYPDPDRIVQVWQINDQSPRNHFSDANFDDVRVQSRSFAAMAQFTPAGLVSVSGTNEAVRARGARVSRDFFAVLGVNPIRGRLFSAEELVENGRRAIVVSRSFWERHLGGSESAIGQTLIYDGTPVTIVGIMPAILEFPVDAEIWSPRELHPRLPSRTAHNWQVIGRLAEDVTLEQAGADVSAIARRLKEALGSQTWMKDVAIVPLQEQIVGRAKSTLAVLLAGSLLLLLIACANVVNLLIARMASRQAEVALRVALGAGRGRMLQQCLAESLMLSLTAAAVGVAIALAGVKVLPALQPDNLPRMHEVRIDWHVLFFAVGIATLAAIGMGIVTAWRGMRGELRDALAQSQRSQGGSMSSERMRRTLVVAQVAMAVVLLVAAGLFAHSFLRLLSVHPGFATERRLVVDISASGRNDERRQLFEELTRRFRELPGVTDVGGANVIPLSGESAGDGTFVIMTSVSEKLALSDLQRLRDDPSRIGQAEFRVASTGYFKAMGIPLQRGRLFEDRDMADAPHVAVISSALARTRWSSEEPIGKVIQFGNMDGNLTPFTIVGVVGDVREVSLATEPQPMFYASYRQRPGAAWRFSFVFATRGDPAAIVTAAQRIVREIRPDLPPRVRTIEAIVSTSIADRRFVLSLVGAFGVAALVLAALGIYSVIAYLVTQRSREIGIRVALGARSEDVVRLVLRQGLTLAATGMVVGAAIALGATRTIERMLYGVSPADPVAFAGVMVVLAAIAVAATWVPARRAARVEAMEVLRTG
jgi:putative ABC transport system permease protein